MISEATSAISATSVSRNLSIGQNKTSQITDSAASTGVSFSEFLGQSAAQLSNDLASAERTAISGISGNATAYEVASAMNEAEQSLKMAIAVRDKIVSAYLEISRMQM